MQLSASTASFRSCTLEEAAGVIRALGFTALDLDGALDSQLDRAKVLAEDPSEIARVRSLDMAIPNLMWTFKTFSLTPAINDPDPAVRHSTVDQFKRVLGFCHAIQAQSILILPGIVHARQPVADARALAVDTFQEMLSLAKEAGITLATEAHLGSAFESPTAALDLLQQVPGLGLVHDYAHFVCQGYQQEEADILLPFTVHVHIRQAKNGMMQMPLDDGTISFVRVLDSLRAVGYSGYLCIEYVHQNYLGANNVDIVTETIKTRDFVRSYL